MFLYASETRSVCSGRVTDWCFKALVTSNSSRAVLPLLPLFKTRWHRGDSLASSHFYMYCERSLNHPFYFHSIYALLGYTRAILCFCSIIPKKNVLTFLLGQMQNQVLFKLFCLGKMFLFILNEPVASMILSIHFAFALMDYLKLNLSQFTVISAWC